MNNEQKINCIKDVLVAGYNEHNVPDLLVLAFYDGRMNFDIDLSGHLTYGDIIKHITKLTKTWGDISGFKMNFPRKFKNNIPSINRGKGVKSFNVGVTAFEA